MLGRLADLLVRRRRVVLLTTLGFVLIAGAIGGKVASRLSSGGFTDPGVQSSRAADILRDTFHQGDPNLLLLVTAPSGVDSPAAEQAARALTTRLAAEPQVTQVVSYWSLGRATGLRSRNATQALVLARITGSDDEIAKRVTDLGPKYSGRDGPLTLQVGGQAEAYHEVNHQIREATSRARRRSRCRQR